jgi:Tfp pilus assembly protein PilN
MINLLPPDLKEQIRFAKLNRMALRYLRVVVAVVVVLGVIFAGALYLVKQQAAGVGTDVSSSQQTIDSLNSSVIPLAQDASNRLTAIQYVQSTQTHFSKVISDLASVLPQGVTIDSLTLNGNTKLPVTMSLTANTYDEALAVRNALATSPRIAYVDLESIAGQTSSGITTYNVAVVIAFKTGEEQ